MGTQTQPQITERTYQNGLHILACVDKLVHDGIAKIVKKTTRQIKYRLDRGIEIVAEQRRLDNFMGNTYDITIKGKEEEINGFIQDANYYVEDLIIARLQGEKK